MHPIGTHVTIHSVDHLAEPRRHRRLIGRAGVVGDHEGDMNIVAGIGWVITGYYAFADDDLVVTGSGSAPDMPRRYRVHGYHAAAKEN